jgi:N-acetylmuramoyl-L-alanine amidase
VEDSLEKGEKVTVVSQSGDWLQIESGGGTGWIASWLTAKSNAGEAKSASGKNAVSTVDRLNVRAEPDVSASVLAQMNAGEGAKVIGESDGWLEVEFRNTRGFVSKQYISTSEPTKSEPAPATSDISSFQIAVDALNVRSKPDLSSSIETTVKNGDVFPVESMDGNWVEIRLSEGGTGWVYAFHGHLSSQSVKVAANPKEEAVTVLTDGTNLRTEASTSSGVAARANAGDRLQVVSKSGDWYQVALPDGQQAYIAEWVVTSDETKTASKDAEKKEVRKEGTLNGLTIVLDPGHGGNDGGTVGARDTKEKDLTLETAETLSHHLRSAGADVILTRQSDTYVDLRKRVSAGHQVAADAFISLHYDAAENSSVSGFTTYYQLDYQYALAESVNEALGRKIDLRNRGVRAGNYLVLRENRQAAILVELGYLSNFNDERIVTSGQFQEQAALGLYNGIVNYFDAKLE